MGSEAASREMGGHPSVLDAVWGHPGGVVEGDLHLRLLRHADPQDALALLEDLQGAPAGLEARRQSLRLAQRAQSRAMSLQARYAATLAAMDLFTAADVDGSVSFAAEEIGMTLGVSRLMAERLVRVGRAVTTGPLFETGLALHAGAITFEVAWAFVDALACVALPVALAVEGHVLPTAPGRTAAEVRAAIARALVELDPDDADERHARARRSRYVSRPQALPDGMARLSVFLPADRAVALDTALDAAAAAAHAAGDFRNARQLRADTLGDWAIGALANGVDVATTSGQTVRSAPAKVRVTVPLEVLVRVLPGFTPPPSVAAVLHAEMTGETVDTGAGPAEGHRTEAAWLEGYGPVPPVIAHLLAAGGSWQRIVTDSLTGAPLDIGRARYVPPANIAQAVRLRDLTCTRPGCTIPAGRCELDHVDPWAHGGLTGLHHLTCLCPRCHRGKTLRLGRPGPLKPDGTRDWISVTGRIYTARPVRPPRLRGGPAPKPHASDDGDPSDPDPPPF